MKIPEFTIRASACGKIMGKKGLGLTGETYCKNWLKGKLFNRQVEIKSKYLEKGTIMEDNSLDEVAKRLGLAILLKNDKHYSNKWMRGTPDAIVGDCVIDVKNSWSWETLPLLETQIPFDIKTSLGYYWQLQTYMALTKKKRSKLVYTLLDTPEHLIQNEAYWYSKKNGYGELTDEMLAEFTKNMTYGDVPEEYKYKSFDIERNDADIQLIKDRVIECREYIKTLSVNF
ncbi:MAG: hypothetical protein ACUZ8E_03125 [Candidatus Anammoxibacter sp.]